MYKLIAFDFDGTLADTFPWFVKTAQVVVDRFGLAKLDPDMIEPLRSMSAREILMQLSVPPWKLPLIATYARYKLTRESSSIALFPDIHGTLEFLAASGISLAVVSSNSSTTVRRVLGEDALANIDRLECGASLFGKAKKLTRLLRATGIEAHEALYVGDEIRDCDASRIAGMAFAAVAWGYTRQHALAACAPDHMFVSVSELRRLVPACRPLASHR